MKANISNIQKIYSEIPRTWEFEGVTYQGYQHFKHLHFEHGWRDVKLPEFNPETQKLSDVYILVDDVVTKQVINLSKEGIEEIKKASIPQTISQVNLRKQLILKGISIDKIYQTIDSLPSPNKEIIYIMWEYSTQFSRNATDLLAMAQMLKIDAKTLDEIFINGNI